MSIKNTNRCGTIATTLIILSFLFAACSKAAHKPEDLRLLKKAAIDCNMAAFSHYMPEDTANKVKEFEGYTNKVNQALDSIFEWRSTSHPLRSLHTDHR